MFEQRVRYWREPGLPSTSFAQLPKWRNRAMVVEGGTTLTPSAGVERWVLLASPPTTSSSSLPALFHTHTHTRTQSHWLNVNLVIQYSRPRNINSYISTIDYFLWLIFFYSLFFFGALFLRSSSCTRAEKDGKVTRTGNMIKKRRGKSILWIWRLKLMYVLHFWKSCHIWFVEASF